MGRGALEAVLRHLRRAATSEDGLRPDAELLERFIRLRDEDAFELLMHRHGPMVLSTCRRVLRQAQDAEDAFQATFLLLARKAGSIGKREALAGWLYRVAHRVALRARKREARHPVARTADVEPVAAAPTEPAGSDLRPVLDAELSRLPAKYRDVVLLCYLEGRTYAEAARQLACPRGTVSIRLRRARELLRARLSRRGVTLATPILVAALTQAAVAKVPAPLTLAALRLAILSPPVQAAAASGPAVALAEGVLRAMFLTKLKVVAGLVLLIALAGGGAVLLSQAREPGARHRGGHRAERQEPDRRGLIRVPSERDGVLLVVGTDIKKGAKVEADQQVIVKVGDEKKTYRLLREGNRVEEGQLLARVDDRLARAEVAIKQAKVETAEADQRAAAKTRDEAEKRYDAVVSATRRIPGTHSKEELRAAKLTWDRYAEEERAKVGQVRVAKAELRAAETILLQYEIRSPVAGVIKRINFHRGEAVRALETVFLIQTGARAESKPKAKAGAKVDVRSDMDGRLVLVGTEIKPGEKVAPEQTEERQRCFLAIQVPEIEWKKLPADQRVKFSGSEHFFRRWLPQDPLTPGKLILASKTIRYRKLIVGDSIKKGQLIAVVDDDVAYAELTVRVAKLEAAEADYKAAKKTRDEAEKRYEAMMMPIRRVGKKSKEAVRELKVTWDHSVEEARSKAAAVKAAQGELAKAYTHLRLHEIRSRYNGVITALYKEPGDAVKTNESVARIERDKAP